MGIGQYVWETGYNSPQSQKDAPGKYPELSPAIRRVVFHHT